MSLSNMPSEKPQDAISNPDIDTDTQNRVTTVAKEAIAILDGNADAKIAVRNLFGQMIAQNLRDPENVFKLQKGLFDARDARLAVMKPEEKLGALQAFSQFMERFTEQLARINGSIALSNEARAITDAAQAKIEQVKATYASILTESHTA